MRGGRIRAGKELGSKLQASGRSTRIRRTDWIKRRTQRKEETKGNGAVGARVGGGVEGRGREIVRGRVSGKEEESDLCVNQLRTALHPTRENSKSDKEAGSSPMV